MSLFGDINKVEIMGNVTQDPELRYTSSGTPVCNISVATNRSYKQGEEWKDETEFHNIVIWGNLAQGVAQRASKGTRLLVTGRLQTRNWEGQDGKKNYRTELIAEDVFLIDRYEKGKSEDLPEPKVTNNAPGDLSNSENPSSSPKSSGSSSSNNNSDDIIDPDDLPF